MGQRIDLIVNDRPVQLDVQSNELLVDVLRERLRLTGTKKGCGGGECGACTVLLDGRSVSSCLVLAMKANGSSILTIEGLAHQDQLHILQQKFIEYGAAQCGFCTPGMLLSAKVLLDQCPIPTITQIKEAIAGNLCRCTGYVKIIEAIYAASQTISMKEPVG